MLTSDQEPFALTACLLWFLAAACPHTWAWRRSTRRQRNLCGIPDTNPAVLPL